MVLFYIGHTYSVVNRTEQVYIESISEVPTNCETIYVELDPNLLKTILSDEFLWILEQTVEVEGVSIMGNKRKSGTRHFVKDKNLFDPRNCQAMPKNDSTIDSWNLIHSISDCVEKCPEINGMQKNLNSDIPTTLFSGIADFKKPTSVNLFESDYGVRQTNEKMQKMNISGGTPTNLFEQNN